MKALYSREHGYPARRGRGGAEDEESAPPPIIQVAESKPSFPIAVAEPEPYVSRSDLVNAYTGGSYYPEQNDTYPIRIRKPTGYKSPAIKKHYDARVYEKAMLDENTRRRLGKISRGNIV
jgi:hypothetical protein